jgi:hypothetical protein
MEQKETIAVCEENGLVFELQCSIIHIIDYYNS